MPMIDVVIDFIKKFINEKKPTGKVIDIGGRDVNGSPKDYFVKAGMEYTCLDLIKGKNVDIVMNADDIPSKLKSETYDVVCCLETLEHVKKPWIIIENCKYLLKKGGWLILTAPSINHPKHEWPGDYYRYFETTFREVFFEGYENITTWEGYWGETGSEIKPDAVLGYGRKPL